MKWLIKRCTSRLAAGGEPFVGSLHRVSAAINLPFDPIGKPFHRIGVKPFDHLWIGDFGAGKFVARPFAAEVDRAQDRVFTPAWAFRAQHPKVDRFQNVDFARCGPGTIAGLFRQHPDGRPGALPLRQFGAHFDPAKAPGGAAPGAKPGRGKVAGRLGLGTCRQAPLRFGQGRASGAFAARGDHQFAVFNPGVAAAAGVTLALIVSAAPAIDIEAPFGPVDRSSAKFIGPDQCPAAAFGA